MNKLVQKTLQLVFSSTRTMPAHFTSNGDRKQSFCIDYKPLTAKHDFAMSSESWGSVSDFLSPEKLEGRVLSKPQFDVVVRCGEDLMVGAFILTTLGGVNLLDDMREAIIDDTIETFDNKVEGLSDVFSAPQVNRYFDYCVTFGNDEVKK